MPLAVLREPLPNLVQHRGSFPSRSEHRLHAALHEARIGVHGCGFCRSIGAERNEAAKAFVEFLHLAMGVEQQ